MSIMVQFGRRTGKTTRLIDEAIQFLFDNGQITLCDGRHINKSEFIDPDHEEGNMAQDNFIHRFLKRLDSEHGGSRNFIVDKKERYVFIKVK